MISLATTVTLLVVGAGLSELPDWGAAAEEANVAREDQGLARTSTKNGLLDVEVQAQHIGKLRLQVGARLTVNERPLSQVKVEAFADMVEMSGAHVLGPFGLHEMPTYPGFYTARVQLPMPGEYEVQVVARTPIPGIGTTNVFAGVVDGSDQSAP